MCWTIETSTGEHSLVYYFLPFSWHVYYHSCLHTCVFHHECVTIRSCRLGVGAHITNCSSRAWAEHKASWDEEEIFVTFMEILLRKAEKVNTVFWLGVTSRTLWNERVTTPLKVTDRNWGEWFVLRFESANTWSGTFSSFMRKKTVVKWLSQFILTWEIWLKRLSPLLFGPWSCLEW